MRARVRSSSSAAAAARPASLTVLLFCLFAAVLPASVRGRRRERAHLRGVGGRDAGDPAALPGMQAALEAEHVCTWVPQEVADERLRADPPQALGPAQAGPARSAAILAVRADLLVILRPARGRAVGRGHRRRAALRAGTGPEDRAAPAGPDASPGRSGRAVRDAVARRGRKLEIWSVLAFTHPAAAGKSARWTCRSQASPDMPTPDDDALDALGTRCRCSSSRGCRFARTRSWSTLRRPIGPRVAARAAKGGDRWPRPTYITGELRPKARARRGNCRSRSLPAVPRRIKSRTRWNACRRAW